MIKPAAFEKILIVTSHLIEIRLRAGYRPKNAIHEQIKFRGQKLSVSQDQLFVRDMINCPSLASSLRAINGKFPPP